MPVDLAREIYGYLYVDIPVFDPYSDYPDLQIGRPVTGAQPLYPRHPDVFVGMWWNGSELAWNSTIFTNSTYNASAWVVSCKISLLSLYLETQRYDRIQAEAGNWSMVSNGTLQHKFAAFLVLVSDASNDHVTVTLVSTFTGVVVVSLIVLAVYLHMQYNKEKKQDENKLPVSRDQAKEMIFDNVTLPNPQQQHGKKQ